MLLALANGIEEHRLDRLAPLTANLAVLDLHDVLEILDWHAMRLNLVDQELRGDSMNASLLNPSKVSKAPPQGTESSIPKCLTGHPCTGSWMVGLFQKTQSPGLSSKILQEISSLESAKKRASMGAGLPARKDFYAFHGHEPVTHAEYLTWSELYRLCASRARRRDRVVCGHMRVSDLTRVVHRELRDCLKIADELNTKPQTLAMEARRAIGRILDAVQTLIRDELRAQKGTTPITCAQCMHQERCCRLATADDPIPNQT